MCQVLYLINLQTPENYYQKETEREERVGNLPKGTRLEGTQLGFEQGLSSSARRAQRCAGSACGSGSRTQGGAYLYLAGVTQRAAGEGGGLLLLPSTVYPNLTV